MITHFLVELNVFAPFAAKRSLSNVPRFSLVEVNSVAVPVEVSMKQYRLLNDFGQKSKRLTGAGSGLLLPTPKDTAFLALTRKPTTLSLPTAFRIACIMVRYLATCGFCIIATIQRVSGPNTCLLALLTITC